jgi:hypothetical protein
MTNYKVQYQMLKEKMQSYPGTKFLLWTGPALVRNHTNAEEATIARDFFNWVRNVWDEPNDNIFLWDFRKLETDENGLYLDSEFAAGPNNSHPSAGFGEKVAPLFVRRLTDVMRHNGKHTMLTGTYKNREQ